MFCRLVVLVRLIVSTSASDWLERLVSEIGDVITHSPLWGSFLFMHTFCRTTTKIDVVLTRGRGLYIGVSHVTFSKTVEFQRSPIFWFSCIYAYTLKSRMTKFGMVTHGEGCVLRGHPRHCICASASRGLSSTAEFLVFCWRNYV